MVRAVRPRSGGGAGRSGFVPQVCGFALDEATPDETTICRFRNDLKAAGPGEALFTEVTARLDRAGFMREAGTLIDASLVEAAVRRAPDGSTPKARGIKDRIQHRRTRSQRALPHWRRVRNKLIGRVRAGVERRFSQLRGRYGMRRMRYRGLAANRFHLDLIAMAHDLHRAAALA